MHGQLRLNEFTAHDLRKMNLSLDNFTMEKFFDYYDACEEIMLEQGFVLWDDEIQFEKEVHAHGIHEFRFNCGVVACRLYKDEYIVTSVKIAFWHINSNKMNDLEKLVYAVNHLQTFKDGNGEPEPDSKKAQAYLLALIDRMKDNDIKNIK